MQLLPPFGRITVLVLELRLERRTHPADEAVLFCFSWLLLTNARDLRAELGR